MKEDLTDLFALSGKVAAITGGGGVLCGAIARALGKLGVKVAILDISEEAAKRAADDIVSGGGEAMALKTDVLNKESLEEASSHTAETFGKVDILINGAGGNKPEATTTDELEFFDLPESAVRWVFDLNFMGTFFASQVFGRQMAARGEGIIINVSSMNYFRPLTRVSAYSAAKAAVSNFTQWLAVHMSHNYSKKIRVNAIAPGFFLTEQNRFLLTDERTGELTPRGKTIIDHTPMAKFGAPEDLIGTIVWLLSSASQFVHGITVPIDGGFSSFSGV
jgi:NAD(P)-dependent dehydrogenase (short-subunit alcohol dehydrogenase family)